MGSIDFLAGQNSEINGAFERLDNLFVGDDGEYFCEEAGRLSSWLDLERAHIQAAIEREQRLERMLEPEIEGEPRLPLVRIYVADRGKGDAELGYERGRCHALKKIIAEFETVFGEEPSNHEERAFRDALMGELDAVLVNLQTVDEG